MKRTVLILALATVPSLCGGPVMAGNLSVTPIGITLASPADSATMTVSNNGGEKVTVQVDAKKWMQGEGGDEQLLPTEDILFFPGLLEMHPGEKRIIRVGYDGAEPGAVERTYRVFVSELPVGEPGGAALRFAITLSIPVFLSPPREVFDVSIGRIEVDGDNVSLTITNAGNTHVMPKKMAVVGLDRTGSEAFSKEVSGWYVLAGVNRTFATALEEGECEKAALLRVTAVVGGRSIEGQSEVDGSACSP